MSKLKIAIQKNGRLRDGSLKLLRDCGISIDNGNNQLKVAAANFPLEILYLKNSDIPQYVEDGVSDVAIVGENLLIEKSPSVEIVKRLGFAKCRVSLAVPKEVDASDPTYFANKKIATSYPNTLKSYLDKRGISAEIHEISGSVEIAPNIGLADGICDIISTGNTLFQNGLKEVSTILNSESCLIRNNDLGKTKLDLLDKLVFRMNTVQRASNSKYILLNVPNEKIDKISQILPVLRSPTIMPLADEGWSSMHSVIDEDKFWDVIDQLKEAGAEGILVIPIEKMIL